ncbi:MAG TPA: ribosome silencing factor [Acidimicrobiales bacterium]|nr:ribosome silencing factor [Acidimicrobiales bacterium]
MIRSQTESTTLAATAARAATDKKGEDTIVLEVGPLLSITDAFVITSGSNDRQVRTIAEEVEAQVRTAMDRAPLRVEGLSDAHWILLDYGDVVVHVFLDETRRYYDLERLWADAPRIIWEDDGPGRSEAARA